MPHSKTPGGQAPSAKFEKQQAEAQGVGAKNAPGHTEGHKPGDAPVAGDAPTSTVGVEAGTNQPGEKGTGVQAGGAIGEKVGGHVNQGNQK